MRNFFAKYSKRKEFKNTIFVIVGDHHNGSIPTENAIKCYNVPLIIYSPLLKKAEHFESVNAHINITPTLIALLRDSYHLQYSPHYVSWIGDVMDTCKSFRNIHDVPLIGVNRTIREYVYKENYLYLNSLYRFNTKMTQVEIVNDELVEQLNTVLDNFKFINSYVCNSNKLYPKDENMFESHETLLANKIDTAEHVLSTTNTCEYIDKGSFIAKNNKQIKIKISLSGNIDPKDFFKLPSIAFYIYSSDGKRQLLYSPKEMQELYKMPSNNTVWGSYADEDIFDLSKYNDTKGYCIKIQLCNEKNIKMKIKDLKIEFLQIK